MKTADILALSLIIFAIGILFCRESEVKKSIALEKKVHTLTGQLTDRTENSVTECLVFSGEQKGPYLRENYIIGIDMARAKKSERVMVFSHLPGDRMYCE